jgi:hypothetical protein
MSGVYINANRVYSSTEFSVPNAGDSVEGGLFVGTFVSGSTLMGIVVSESDLSTSAQWGTEGINVLDTFRDIGKGDDNTENIVNTYGELDEIAAALCYNLNESGYNDWFLPSEYELVLIYSKLASIGLGGFSNHSYWSSTQADVVHAYTVDMNNGNSTFHKKEQTNRHTRAARYYVIGTVTFPVSPTIYVNSSTATVVTYPSPPVESPTFYINPITSSNVTDIVTGTPAAQANIIISQ